MPFLMEQFYKPAQIEAELQHQQDLHQVRQVELQQAQQQKAILAQRQKLYQQVWGEAPNDTTSVEGSPQWQSSMANQSQRYNQIAAMLSKSGDYEGAKIAQEEGRKLSLSAENVQKRQEEIKAKKVEDAGTSAASFLTVAADLKTPEAIQKEWTGEDGYSGKWAEFRDKGVNLPRDITEAIPKLKGMQVSSKQGLDLLKAENSLQERAADRAAREQHWNELAEIRREQMRTTALEREKKTADKQEKKSKDFFIQQRQVAAANLALGTVETFNEFAKGTTTGILSSMTTKDGMINAVRNKLVREMAPTEQKQMQTMFKGLGRNLATIEASGMAQGLTTIAKQMEDGVYITAGDDAYSTAMKLAEIKRIVTDGISTNIRAGALSGAQAQEAQRILDGFNEAIPYSTKDVAIASRKPGTKTVGESSKDLIPTKTTGEYNITMKGTLSGAQEKNLNSAMEYAKKKGWSQEQLERALKAEGFPL